MLYGDGRNLPPSARKRTLLMKNLRELRRHPASGFFIMHHRPHPPGGQAGTFPFRPDFTRCETVGTTNRFAPCLKNLMD